MTITWTGLASSSLTKQKRDCDLASVQRLEQRANLTQLVDTQDATRYMRGHWLGQSNSRSDGETR